MIIRRVKTGLKEATEYPKDYITEFPLSMEECIDAFEARKVKVNVERSVDDQASLRAMLELEIVKEVDYTPTQIKLTKPTASPLGKGRRERGVKSTPNIDKQVKLW